MALFQVHHQFEDGHTEFISQRENSDSECIDVADFHAWMDELWESDPPPMCARFMVCTEDSPHFVMMAP